MTSSIARLALVISPVNREIPNNVDVNINYYQTGDSVPSILSQRSDRADSSDSSEPGGSSYGNSGSPEWLWSRGNPNEPAEGSYARIYNREIEEVMHQDIDEYTLPRVIEYIDDFLNSDQPGRLWRPYPSPGTLYRRRPGLLEQAEQAAGRFMRDLERGVLWQVAPHTVPFH